ncbi:TetR/AcrR family transcriptional regulator [Microbacterium sp.]|uniref:TetR/AcrR family transcriptional regulator n=1 Tax=Microbacterium sp. TaxID=51671 RepID=UPI0039E61646
MSTRGPGRPRETSHEEIREIARVLFTAQGYAATSLAQIAKAAGISRTTLFEYFPAKRDLIWEEFESGLARLRASLDGEPARPLVEIMATAMIAAADYPAQEHDALRLRWRLTQDDPELRAYTAVRTEQLVGLIVDRGRRHSPDVDPELIDHVARALVTVAARCVETWARAERPETGLADHVAAGLAPFTAALRPLLPS